MSGRLDSDAEWKVEMTRMPLDIVMADEKEEDECVIWEYRAVSRLLLFSICLYGYKEYS